MRIELEKLSAFIAETKSAMMAKASASAQGNAQSAMSGQANSLNESGDAAAHGGQQVGAVGNGAPVARMLRMAEDIHELAWTLQADELSPDSCEAIARHASMLYAVSRQQAMESERALKFVAALDDAANRLTILLDALVHELNTYQGEGEGVPPPHDEQVTGHGEASTANGDVQERLTG